jgi:ketosteroid isomerase-like protein
MAFMDEYVIRQLLEAFNQRNLEPALKLVTDEAVLHVPGKSQISGDYHGKDGVRKFWMDQISITGGSFTGEAITVLRGDGHLVLILALTAQREGKTYNWRRVNHYQIIEGRIVEGWIFESNQDIVDEIFA